MNPSPAVAEPDAVALLDAHTFVMERIAAGAPLSSVLDAVAIMIDEVMPGARCSILLLDAGRLRHGAAPHLPRAYNEAIDGIAIGPSAGSCGTAAFLDEPVVAEDVTSDSHWVDFRDLAARHGLRACWSTPIRGQRGVLGTFAVYHDRPFTPSPRDEAIVRRISHLASIAIEHDELFRERQARSRAEEAQHAAVTASRAKSAFIATFSHELRTPLQAITGFIELLQTLDLPPERRRDALDRMDRAASHILTLVEDSLDIARIEAGALRLHLAPTDPVPIIDDVLDILRPLAEPRHITLLRSTTAGGSVLADGTRLRQVLLNVVGNAVRYAGERAHVSVDVDATTVTVRDDGPGISPAMQELLFVPFQRLGDGDADRSGAGLGLVLARNLVELMGGTLRLHSEVGVGTTVEIVLAAS